MTKRILSIVVPAYNEAETLPHLVARLKTALATLPYTLDIIIVDDGSADDTRAVIQRLRQLDPTVKALHLSRNFGKEAALATGLMHATGDAAVLIDADLQHPPELIPKLLDRFEAGYDMVYAVRQSRETDTFLRRQAARAYYALFNAMSGTRLPEGAGDFRLLSRKAIDAMNRLGERSRFNKGLYSWIGFKSVGVPYHLARRDTGASKWSFHGLFGFAFDGLASFSILPLRIASALGLVTSCGAIVYGAYFVTRTLLFGIDVPGFPSLIISIMFFSGVQLICLGVLGEYLGRVYEETKGRPLVVIDEAPGFQSAATPILDKVRNAP